VHFDFAAFLVLATALTGIIWLIDRLAFASSRGEGKEPMLVEYARSFFPVLLIVLVVRSFIAEPFRIPSNSMMPTLLTGDFILVNKFSYGIRLPVTETKVIPLGEPERGDVVVFRYPVDPRQDYIKRVIALPGDVVEYRNKVLSVNGERVPATPEGSFVGVGSGREMTGAALLHEQLGNVAHKILVDPRLRSRPDGEATWRVPEGHYFVMGDNRDNSQDSRFWGFVPEENLVGRAFFIWMNWDGKNGGIDFSRIGTVIH
jgi:signal peptidase I